MWSVSTRWTLVCFMQQGVRFTQMWFFTGTDLITHRQRETERDRERQRERQRETERDRERDRERQRERQRETERDPLVFDAESAYQLLV